MAASRSSGLRPMLRLFCGGKVMSAVPPDASLERLFGLLKAHNPHLLELLCASTERDFVIVTEKILEHAIRTIEGGAKRYHLLDERGLSRLLADFLNLAVATHRPNGTTTVTLTLWSSIHSVPVDVPRRM